MEITFNNLTCGYFDANGLFVPLTLVELQAGKQDLPKNVKLVVRGDVRRGPFDLDADGILDGNQDGQADTPGDATLQQYLIPDEANLLNSVHYYARSASALVGGTTGTLTGANGGQASDPKVQIITNPPGTSFVLIGIPAYWYLVIQPVGGNGALLSPGSIVEIGVNPRLPYKVISTTLAGGGIFNNGGTLEEGLS